MFRTMISPILRSTRLCLQPVVKTPTMLSADDHDVVILVTSRQHRPKHVELVEIFNKIIIVASSWLYVLLDYVNWSSMHGA